MKGFNEYQKMFDNGTLMPGRVIEVYAKPEESGLWKTRRYRVVDKSTLEPLQMMGNPNPRKTLQAREWKICSE